jgi:hypothetical protein
MFYKGLNNMNHWMTWLVLLCNRYPSWVFMQYMYCRCHHLLHLFQILEVLIIYDCQLYNIFVFVNKLLVSVNSVSYCLHCGSKQTLHYAVFLFFSSEDGGKIFLWNICWLSYIISQKTEFFMKPCVGFEVLTVVITKIMIF